jgi:hypothetical protein
MKLPTNEAKWTAWQDYCYANSEYWNKQRSIYPTDWQTMAEATSWEADYFEAKNRTGRFTELIDSVNNINDIQAIGPCYLTSKINYVHPTKQELENESLLDEKNVQFQDQQYHSYIKYLDDLRD